MVKKTNKIKLDKKDYLRALLTDTTPDDVPIVFSNDGMYINSHRAKQVSSKRLDRLIKLLYTHLIEPQDDSTRLSQSYPHKYKIIKNELSLRTISLLHPRAQINFVHFYQEYNEIITYLCSLSPFSIRAPEKVGNSFYSKNVASINKYKEITIDTLESELVRKHASSFFAYRGIDRIYKLYTSRQYIQLEKQYPFMWFLDVAHCFDSIYTHSISWAVKNKAYIKAHARHSNQFCQQFDTLMQRSNNNETNGINIGSEVSRIFAEIIFQSIDLKIIAILKSRYSFFYGGDYTVLRYVDDYIIFSKSEHIMETVSQVISDSLNSYNLYINENKVKKYTRPFCTEKSHVIIKLKSTIEKFESTLFVFKRIDKNRKIYAKEIFRKSRFIHAFVDKVKSLCSANETGYSDVSSYLISVFSRRILELTESVDTYSNEELNQPEYALVLRQAISILMELMFFFYSVHGTVSASNKLAKTIIIVDEFLIDYFPKYLPFIRTEIIRNINQISLDRKKSDSRDGYISLERLNIVLATSKFGTNYLLSPEYFNALLKNVKNLTYFNIVSLLYYFQNHNEYAHLVEQIEQIITEKLNDKVDLLKDSESVHLFLDILSCPYVSLDLRKDQLQKLYNHLNPPFSKISEALEEDIQLLSQAFWFVKWQGLDLLKLLERKELKSTY